MSPRTKKRPYSLLFLCFTVILIMIAACKSTPNSRSLINPDTGKHATDWVSAHPSHYVADPGQCSDCHGTDLKGGISGVSCFSADFSGVACHALGPAGHPANWAVPSEHGTAAKGAPSRVPITGFSVCAVCHGSDFNGGAVGMNCFTCHGGSAPHPTAWMPTSTYQHNTTDTANAATCALCHLNGLNSPVPSPNPAAPAGTAPGCFNSTLCHGVVGHAAGWDLPDQHGAHAKAAPDASTTSGFSICQTCHGNNFTGGTSLQTCLNANCHGSAASPHPAAWSPDSTYRHNTTNQANAPVCALCHRQNTGTAGCFNNTLCHGNP